MMRNREEYQEEWKPKTMLGKQVLDGTITNIDEIFEKKKVIKEPQIVDKLLPGIENDIIFIGGSTGKGGGKKMTPTKRTTRMHMSGRRYTVSSVSVVGNKDGYIGIGKAESQDRKAIFKAIDNAKLNVIKIRRGSGSWESSTSENHSIPYKIVGSHGSVRVKLMPAPKGLGLCAKKEAKKILRLAGIKDIWVKSYGNTGSRVNYAFAVFDALKNLSYMKNVEEVAEDAGSDKA